MPKLPCCNKRDKFSESEDTPLHKTTKPIPNELEVRIKRKIYGNF